MGEKENSTPDIHFYTFGKQKNKINSFNSFFGPYNSRIVDDYIPKELGQTLIAKDEKVCTMNGVLYRILDDGRKMPIKKPEEVAKALRKLMGYETESEKEI